MVLIDLRMLASMSVVQSQCHESQLWAASASMDASLLGECYSSLWSASPRACIPHVSRRLENTPTEVTDRILAWDELSVCTAPGDEDRFLAWDELSVCTEEESETRSTDICRVDVRVFGADIVALAGTVLRAFQHIEYQTTQARVKHATLSKLRTNLQGIVPKLLIITEHAKYANTPVLNAALLELYAKLRSENRLVKAVYGYPSRQIKVFYAAWMRERAVCKAIREGDLSRNDFLQACMPLHSP